MKTGGILLCRRTAKKSNFQAPVRKQCSAFGRCAPCARRLISSSFCSGIPSHYCAVISGCGVSAAGRVKPVKESRSLNSVPHGAPCKTATLLPFFASFCFYATTLPRKKEQGVFDVDHSKIECFFCMGSLFLLEIVFLLHLARACHSVFLSFPFIFRQNSISLFVFSAQITICFLTVFCIYFKIMETIQRRKGEKL